MISMNDQYENWGALLLLQK